MSKQSVPAKKSGSGQNNYGATCNHRFFVLIVFLPANVIVLTELYENENNKPKKVKEYFESRCYASILSSIYPCLVYKAYRTQ